jgi:lipopolysaccharide transport system ATP-binding protein
MSSSDLAISVRGLSKRYTIMHRGARPSLLAESIMQKLRHPFRRDDRETFWALRDVAFDVHKGDVVGIIGRNGAGKSTLLKILSQITEPTAGRIDLYGRVGSLLEVGTGFHPELTGRENVYLNGAILGMRRKEIQRQFDAIVAFSGVEKFIDTPAKRYSSGMAIRLAFAVAAHLNPEILIVDEVLAVGDAEFQKKCLGKMKEVSRGEGRTVLFVSHNMAAVRQLCTHAVYLKEGQVVKQGPAEAVLDLYSAARQKAEVVHTANKYGLAFIDLSMIDLETGAATDRPLFNRDYALVAHVRAERPLTHAALNLRIFDESGVKVSSLCSVEEGIAPFTMDGDVRLEFRLPRLGLYGGQYNITLEVERPNDPVRYLTVEDALAFEVQPAIIADAMWSYDKSHGIVRVTDGARLLPANEAGSEIDQELRPSVAAPAAEREPSEDAGPERCPLCGEFPVEPVFVPPGCAVSFSPASDIWNDNCSSCTARSTLCTDTSEGTVTDTGAKFKIPRMPAATRRSATDCAASEGTDMMARRIFNSAVTAGRSRIGRIVRSPNAWPVLRSSASKIAAKRKPFRKNPR